MNDHSKADSKSSEYDLYATLMLSNLLDNEQQKDVTSTPKQSISEQQPNCFPVLPPAKESQVLLYQQQLDHEEQDSNEDNDYSNVIWVPADKHPEIAPNEFANFIKTHGADTLLKRSSSLRRRKSILSQSLTSRTSTTTVTTATEDDEEDESLSIDRSLSEKKRAFLKRLSSQTQQQKAAADEESLIFNRYSATVDESQVIAPKRPTAEKSLLRRSAFSARGRNRSTVTEDRRQKRRTVSQKESTSSNTSTKEEDSKSTKTNASWDKLQGISLYDQPVNMSEWIDLGNASFESEDEQRGILSRVHDAESQLRSKIDIDNDENEDTSLEKDYSIGDAGQLNNTSFKEVTLDNYSTATPSLPPVMVNRHPSMTSFETDIDKTSGATTTIVKPEKRSWLSSIFNDRKNSKRLLGSMTTTTSSPLSGFTSLLSRSLSLKSNQSIATAPISPSNKISSNNSITTFKSNIFNTSNKSTTTTPTNSDKKKISSGLETPPLSEKTFFINSNRLPIHVERAIYRLSHMKLADPRRHLSQQVLISNLMFWYLSIQQNDFSQTAHLQLQQQQQEQMQIPKQDNNSTPQKKPTNTSKMSRLIHSARKKRNEVAQFVQTYPIAVNQYQQQQQQQQQVRPPLNKSVSNNIQFSLPIIPNHHSSTNHVVNHIFGDNQDDEEDNVPLSHYRS